MRTNTPVRNRRKADYMTCYHRAAAVGKLLLGLATVAAPAYGQGTVNGWVTDAGTGEPIVGALVTVVGTDIGTTTDQNGELVLLNVPWGTREIRVTHSAYQVGRLRLTVQMGVVTAETIELTRTLLRLDEVVVTGTAGQARRREVGNSIVQLAITDQADPPQSMEMLLAGRAAGVIAMQGGGAAGTSPVANRWYRLRITSTFSLDMVPPSRCVRDIVSACSGCAAGRRGVRQTLILRLSI